MERRRAAGALLALAACIACSAAAPTLNEHTALNLYDSATEGCYYNFQHYGEGDRIMTNEPCLNCTCHNRMLMCYLRVCPFTKPIGQDCIVEKRADQCCPIVTCPDVPVDLLTSTSTTSPADYGATGVGKLDNYGCSINGKYFSEGSKVPATPNKPCEHCYCIRNMTTCVMQECTLHVDGCTPIYHKDVCCPVRYSCDHPEDEIPLLDDMTTTVRPTPGFLLTTTTVAPVTQMTQDCVHDDEIFADGALIKTEKACEHCYCMKGDIVCVVQECGTPMENEGKNCTSLPPREGQCCPDTYICEGDPQEATTVSIETSATEVYQEKLTTLTPPRRHGVEGSGYRNEPDDISFTSLPPSESDKEGSGDEQNIEPNHDSVNVASTTESHDDIPIKTSSPEESEAIKPQDVDEYLTTLVDMYEKPTTAPIEAEKETDLPTGTTEAPYTETTQTKVDSDNEQLDTQSTEKTVFENDESIHQTTLGAQIADQVVTETGKQDIDAGTISPMIDENEGITTESEKEADLISNQNTEKPSLDVNEYSSSTSSTPFLEEVEKVTTESQSHHLVTDTITENEPYEQHQHTSTERPEKITETPEGTEDITGGNTIIPDSETHEFITIPTKPTMVNEPIEQTTEQGELTNEIAETVTQKYSPSATSLIPEDNDFVTTERESSVIHELPETSDAHEYIPSTVGSVTSADEQKSTTEDLENDITERIKDGDKYDYTSTSSSIPEPTHDESQGTVPSKETTMDTDDTVTDKPVVASTVAEELDEQKPTTKDTEDVVTEIAPKEEIDLHEQEIHLTTSKQDVSTESVKYETSETIFTEEDIHKYTSTASPIITYEDDITTTEYSGKDQEFISHITPEDELNKPLESSDKSSSTPFLEEIEKSTPEITETIATSTISQQDIHQPEQNVPPSPTNAPNLEESDITTLKPVETSSTGSNEINDNDISETITPETSTLSETLPSVTLPTHSSDDRVSDNTPSTLSDIFPTSPEDSLITKEEQPSITTEPSFRKEDNNIYTTVDSKQDAMTNAVDIEKTPFTSPSEIPETTASSLIQPESTSADQELSSTQGPQSMLTTVEGEKPDKDESQISEGYTTSDLPAVTTINPGENEIDEDDVLTPGRIPGEGDCLLNGVTYRNESSVPNTNKCSSGCKCLSSIIRCNPIICSPPPEYIENCQPTYDSPDSCCPTYVCDQVRETIPPMPYKHITTPETPKESPATECHGDECEISKNKKDPSGSPDSCTSGKCSTDDTERQGVSECGPQGCIDDSKHHVDHPVHEIPIETTCEGTDCSLDNVPEAITTECKGESCTNVQEHTDIEKPVDSSEHVDTLEQECIGESCRRKEVTNVEQKPICTGVDCQQIGEDHEEPPKHIDTTTLSTMTDDTKHEILETITPSDIPVTITPEIEVSEVQPLTEEAEAHTGESHTLQTQPPTIVAATELPISTASQDTDNVSIQETGTVEPQQQDSATEGKLEIPEDTVPINESEQTDRPEHSIPEITSIKSTDEGIREESSTIPNIADLEKTTSKDLFTNTEENKTEVLEGSTLEGELKTTTLEPHSKLTTAASPLDITTETNLPITETGDISTVDEPKLSVSTTSKTEKEDEYQTPVNVIEPIEENAAAEYTGIPEESHTATPQYGESHILPSDDNSVIDENENELKAPEKDHDLVLSNDRTTEAYEENVHETLGTSPVYVDIEQKLETSSPTSIIEVESQTQDLSEENTSVPSPTEQIVNVEGETQKPNQDSASEVFTPPFAETTETAMITEKDILSGSSTVGDDLMRTTTPTPITEEEATLKPDVLVPHVSETGDQFTTEDRATSAIPIQEDIKTESAEQPITESSKTTTSGEDKEQETDTQSPPLEELQSNTGKPTISEATTISAFVPKEQNTEPNQAKLEDESNTLLPISVTEEVKTSTESLTTSELGSGMETDDTESTKLIKPTTTPEEEASILTSAIPHETEYQSSEPSVISTEEKMYDQTSIPSITDSGENSGVNEPLSTRLPEHEITDEVSTSQPISKVTKQEPFTNKAEEAEHTTTITSEEIDDNLYTNKLPVATEETPKITDYFTTIAPENIPEDIQSEIPTDKFVSDKSEHDEHTSIAPTSAYDEVKGDTESSAVTATEQITQVAESDNLKTTTSLPIVTTEENIVEDTPASSQKNTETGTEQPSLDVDKTNLPTSSEEDKIEETSSTAPNVEDGEASPDTPTETTKYDDINLPTSASSATEAVPHKDVEDSATTVIPTTLTGERIANDEKLSPTEHTPESYTQGVEKEETKSDNAASVTESVMYTTQSDEFRTTEKAATTEKEKYDDETAVTQQGNESTDTEDTRKTESITEQVPSLPESQAHTTVSNEIQSSSTLAVTESHQLVEGLYTTLSPTQTTESDETRTSAPGGAPEEDITTDVSMVTESATAATGIPKDETPELDKDADQHAITEVPVILETSTEIKSESVTDKQKPEDNEKQTTELYDSDTSNRIKPETDDQATVGPTDAESTSKLPTIEESATTIIVPEKESTLAETSAPQADTLATQVPEASTTGIDVEEEGHTGTLAPEVFTEKPDDQHSISSEPTPETTISSITAHAEQETKPANEIQQPVTELSPALVTEESTSIGSELSSTESQDSGAQEASTDEPAHTTSSVAQTDIRQDSTEATVTITVATDEPVTSHKVTLTPESLTTKLEESAVPEIDHMPEDQDQTKPSEGSLESVDSSTMAAPVDEEKVTEVPKLASTPKEETIPVTYDTPTEQQEITSATPDIIPEISSTSTIETVKDSEPSEQPPVSEQTETVPDVVELEEHTHKPIPEITTVVTDEPAIITTSQPEIVSEQQQPSDTEPAEPTDVKVSSTISEESSTPSISPEKPTEPSVIVDVTEQTEEPERKPVPDTEPAEPTDVNVSSTISEESSTPSISPEKPTEPSVIVDVTEQTEEPERKPVPVDSHDILSSTTAQVEDSSESVATEKAPPADKSETTLHSEEITTTTYKPTTAKLEVESPVPVETTSKPEEASSETPLAELPKPVPTEPQPTDELPQPEEEGQFPSSGSSGYGSEPDYGDEDQAFGPGTCRYGGKVYVSAQQIPRDDPCDFCFCFRSDIICLQQSCPPPIHGCHEEPIQGFCCPRYECPVSMATTLNVTTTTTTTTTTLPPHFPTHSYKGAAQRRGCQIKGHTYKVGEVVRASSGPCLHCTCGGDGQMKCDPKACTPEPMLRQMIAAAVSAKRRR